MKAVITKQQFIEKIGIEKKQSLEKRFSVNLDSDITIEEIYDLIEKDKDILINKMKKYFKED